jgi:hypothetical protein
MDNILCLKIAACCQNSAADECPADFIALFLN